MSDKELTKKTITKENFKFKSELYQILSREIFGLNKSSISVMPMLNAENDNHLTDIVIIIKCDKSNIYISDIDESDSDVI